MIELCSSCNNYNRPLYGICPIVRELQQGVRIINDALTSAKYPHAGLVRSKLFVTPVTVLECGFYEQQIEIGTTKRET